MKERMDKECISILTDEEIVKLANCNGKAVEIGVSNKGEQDESKD